MKLSHLSLALVCLFASFAAAQDLLPPIAEGQRIATCGHSFHVFTYNQVAQIAQSAGLKHELVGLSSIGGSTVEKHWLVPEDKSAVKQVLKTGKVDVLTLSPIWLPDPAIEKFIKLGLEHNPDLRITVQEYWLPNDEYEPVYPLQTKKKIDHDATDLTKLAEANARYAKDIEDMVKGINQTLAKPSVLVVPVGQASIALRAKILAGQAPGLKKQWDLFKDNWGHANLPLQFLSSYCHFAVIYRRSPVGLPVPLALKTLKGMSEDDKAKLNTLLQEIAWETVSKHPMAGIMKPAVLQ
ncbi:hypothetical protein [Brevifollis gellanilyticus]|uniref:ABC transporter substrate-binding protein n=1 Tax=Brevifollis gellanilyticus TaxID=748831 RepID=A0A512MCI6_9BACT|nr:hypothetical protein [Brevifollis gellanilyticus]GEP44061.1 hypothetical protein BGE01nite_33520 [Brevifollis gellanilyticus]